MENQTDKRSKNPITKYIWIAIGILSLGITIGIFVAISFKGTEGILGISSSIILSFLAVAFSYYQFYLNKFDSEKREIENQEQAEKRRLADQKVTEIRRLNDIKLSTYCQLLTQSQIIIEDCSKFLNDRNNIDNGNLEKNREFKHLGLALKVKLERIKGEINNYNIILSTSMSFKELEKVNELIEELLTSHYNKEHKTNEYYSNIYNQFINSFNIFSKHLSNILLQ